MVLSFFIIRIEITMTCCLTEKKVKSLFPAASGKLVLYFGWLVDLNEQKLIIKKKNPGAFVEGQFAK